uniref:Doublecortin domain-containing protein n=1 Tax=Globodera pallida TaxID=36090 RepID=A0A183CCZ7_GLOPA
MNQAVKTVNQTVLKTNKYEKNDVLVLLHLLRSKSREMGNEVDCDGVLYETEKTIVFINGQRECATGGRAKVLDRSHQVIPDWLGLIVRNNHMIRLEAEQQKNTLYVACDPKVRKRSKHTPSHPMSRDSKLLNFPLFSY